MSPTHSLESISIVLVKTSHPGNVGSVARAMKTMGLKDLRLVSPLDGDIHRQADALALACGADDVLKGVQVYDNLADAMHDKHSVFALSARLRELGPALLSPEQAAQEVSALDLTQQAGVAFVFGAERTGLSNEDLLMCNRQVCIPANPVYSSLNLAQAVQIVCYALRVQLADNRLQVPSARKAQLASLESVERLKTHWFEAMEAVDFLNADKPRKLMSRLSKMLARAQLEQEELDLLRGFLSDVIRVSENRLYPHELERSTRIKN